MKTRVKNYKKIISCAIGTAILAVALDPTIHVRRYRISTKGRVHAKIAVLSDFHSQPHRALLTKLYREKPELILLPGDIIDDKRPEAPAWAFLEACAQLAPTYYVVGNHEVWTHDLVRIRERLKDIGVHYLENTYELMMLHETPIVIAGISDPYNHKDFDVTAEMERAFTSLPNCYRILLAHRPEEFEKYRDYRFDLVVSGHAHGGQWRVPGLFNGLYAPHQGVFPEHAGGLFTHGGFTHVVCRGTYNLPYLPRIFNPPEFAILMLE